jgi:hypothetical protein
MTEGAIAIPFIEQPEMVVKEDVRILRVSIREPECWWLTIERWSSGVNRW